MTTYLCSTGTSSAKALRLKPQELASWVVSRGGPHDAGRILAESFVDVEPSGAALQDVLSAEIHSLVRMGLSERDRVLLLASSTPDGLACAVATELYLLRHWPKLGVATEQIPGLQVKDSARFRREGVVRFSERCLREIGDYGAEHCVLNPTGGFKALVPYTVLIGMLKRVRCRYLFEQFAEVLELPPLPVEFNRTLFESFRPLFDEIMRESSIPAARWDAEVPYEQRGMLEPLIEREGSEVTLSGIGIVCRDELIHPSSLVPYLSRQAWKDCLDNLALVPDCAPFRFIERVAQEGLRDQWVHLRTEYGLIWLKPGRTRDRYLVSQESGRLLVWRAIREDEEGSDYPTRVIVDPASQRRHYGPFIRMEMHA